MKFITFFGMFVFQKNIKNAIAAVVIFTGLLFITVFSLFAKLEDPLQKILSDAHLPSPVFSAKADFITAEILPYSGFVSPSLQSCIASFSAERNGKIYASFNPNFVLQQTPLQIADEIGAVFGHAVKNNQINWVFDSSSLSYVFYVASGDEALWSCYFKNETQFFKSFFIPQSLQTSLSFSSSEIRRTQSPSSFEPSRECLHSSSEINRIHSSFKASRTYSSAELHRHCSSSYEMHRTQ